MNPTVLVVEDDPTVAEVVMSYLARAGLLARHAADGQTALEMAADAWPDLVVLDLMLPGLDGLEVCRRLRQSGEVPVIMLTALGAEDDRIVGLEVGADDYVAKPFSPRELVLRVQSVLRRSGGSGGSPARNGEATVLGNEELTLDLTAHRALRRGRRSRSPGGSSSCSRSSSPTPGRHSAGPS